MQQVCIVTTLCSEMHCALINADIYMAGFDAGLVISLAGKPLHKRQLVADSQVLIKQILYVVLNNPVS
jgi:hypothetical protein